MIPTIKIPEFTAGRNSYSAVYKSGMTKLKHNVVSRMSAKVMGKGLAVDVFNGVPSNIWFGYMESDYYSNENDIDTTTTILSSAARPITTFYYTLY